MNMLEELDEREDVCSGSDGVQENGKYNFVGRTGSHDILYSLWVTQICCPVRHISHNRASAFILPVMTGSRHQIYLRTGRRSEFYEFFYRIKN